MRYTYLEVFRGIMALWVVVLHGFAFLPSLPNKLIFKFFNDGLLPVLGFVFLSGFVTYILLEKKEPYLFYLKRRAFRLFPVYIAALLVSILILNVSSDVLHNLPFNNPNYNNRIALINDAKVYLPLNILSHLTLTHGLFPNNIFPFSYTLIGQSWSLTLEWQFYIFIPVIYKAITEKKIIYIIISLMIIPAMILSFIYMPQKSFLPNLIHYFLIGFFSYPLFKLYVKENKYYLFYFLLVMAAILGFVHIGISIMIFVFAVLLLLQKLKPKIGDIIFGNKYLLILGNISYSMYCIHMIIYYLVGWFLLKLNINDPILFSLIFISVGAFGTIFISKLTFKYIEYKFISLGRSKM